MNNVPPGYKQTEVGVIPEDWEVKRLKQISPRQSVGLVINPSTYFDKAGTVPLLVGSNVSENSIDSTTANRITKSSNEILSASRLAAGDLVTVRVGEPGVTAVVPLELDGCNCASMMIVRKHSSFDSQWLCCEMNSRHGRGQVEHVQYGTAQKQFNISDAVDFCYPVPPLPEKRAIATALSDVDALLGALDRLIAKKRDLKQAAMQQLLTGQTRLPGFHGEWEVKQLEQSCELITKGTTPTSIGRDFTEGGVNFLKAESISESGEPLVDKVAFIDAATNILLKRSQLKEGDLLISIAGVLGRVGRVSKEILPANTNQALALIRLANASELERDFLFYCLRSPMTTKQISDVNVQAAQANISLQNVRDLEIRVPPTKTEQTAIAAVLTEMDAELAALEQRREKTRALKQGMMQELLTGRIRLVEPRRTARGAAC